MRIVVISQRVDFIETHQEYRDSLDKRLYQFVSHFAKPVAISNVLSASDRLNLLNHIQPNGIILSGGNDIGEYKSRDETERTLLGYAKERKLPVLGICRGMQFLAYYEGASLKPIKNHVRTRHLVLGHQTREVNSYHNYALSQCPSNYEVDYQSEDGCIEGIRHKTLPWIGRMWHPERNETFSEIDIQECLNLFKK